MIAKSTKDYLKSIIIKKKIKSDDKVAIYGTGKGAELLYEVFESLSLADTIKVFIDNNERCKEKKRLLNRDITLLENALEKVDIIIIGAKIHHKIISKRLELYFEENNIHDVEVINPFIHSNSLEDKIEYLDSIEKNILCKKKESFVEEIEEDIRLTDTDPKLIAWYLPQFHQIDVNNSVYGKGFTEWTNTTQMQPIFTGHYQPHIPYDVGYYDLNNDEIVYRQIELAKKYGIYGFSFYYYWFSGERIMEKPVENYLNNRSFKLPFCLTWANENWSALWDAGNKELIYEQRLLDEDDDKFIDDIVKYFKDDRYIKVNGNPMLIVYHINIWSKERVKILFNNFRKRIKKYGFDDIYILVANAGNFQDDAEKWGADGLVEFPPHNIIHFATECHMDCYINPYFNGRILDMSDFITKRQYLFPHKTKKFYRGVMPSWDNSARKATTGANIFCGLNPKTFKEWLLDVIKEGKKIHSLEDNFLFINSWNEWAEGAHLEPDYKYGYAYLNSVKEAIEESRFDINIS